jgi:hypothetical protein
MTKQNTKNIGASLLTAARERVKNLAEALVGIRDTLQRALEERYSLHRNAEDLESLLKQLGRIVDSNEHTGRTLESIEAIMESDGAGLPLEHVGGDSRHLQASISGVINAMQEQLGILPSEAANALSEKSHSVEKALAGLDGWLGELRTEISAVEAGVKQCERLDTLIARSRRQNEEQLAELHRIKQTGDLANAATLERVSRILAFREIYPERYQSLHREFDHARAELIQGCGAFSKTVLRPRIVELRRQATPKVESGLRPHYTDAVALRAAVQHSDLLVELSAIEDAAVIGGGQVDDWSDIAERTISAWKACDAFEAKHLKESVAAA